MSTIEAGRFLSAANVASTVAGADVSTLSSPGGDSGAADRDRWQHLIDYQLIEWGSNSSELEDDGVEPPTRDIIELAIRLAEIFRDDGLPAPSSVVLDANGGIVFEHRKNGLAEVYHVWDDGAVQYQCYRGTRLIRQYTL